MACWDCEHDPCICASIFPFARIRTDDGKIYDHNGGLLHDPANDVLVPPMTEREYDACPWCDGTGGEAMAPCQRCNGDGLIKTSDRHACGITASETGAAGMNISFRGQEIGTYNVTSEGGIVLGHIIRDLNRWIGYDLHIGTFQGDDSATYDTFAAAKDGARAFYANRSFCSCGTLTCAGETQCPYCAARADHIAPSGEVSDAITGTAADAFECGDSLPQLKGTEMKTYEVPVILRITANDAGQAIGAAFSALTDAFEDYERDDFSFEEEHAVPYLHADAWTIRMDNVQECTL